MATSGCGASADPHDGIAAPPPSLPASTCARCRKPAVLAARGTTHCRDCFLSSFRNRFTKHIQPARTAAAAHGVLAYQAAALSASSISAQNPAATRDKKPTLVVACSGGPASTALVHLVHQSLFAPPSDGTAVKSRGNRYSQFLPFDGCEVVFVDQSAVPGRGEDRTDQVRELVASIAPEFTFTALRLEDIFRPPHSNNSNSVCGVSTSVPELPYHPVSFSAKDDREEEEEETSTPREQLVALLSASPSSFSPTSRASLQRSLLDTLLISHVAHSGSEILLLGDTGTRSAIRTLAGMSEGRGYSIGEEVALERIVRVSPSSTSDDDDVETDGDKADKVVMILRPLDQTVDKEIAFYNRECALEDVSGTGSENAGGGAVDVAAVVPEVSAKTRSIPSLVEDFIRTLDADFPSTVPTVVRTAHKLGLRSSHAAFQELASSSSSSQPSTSSPSSAATREIETNCPLCGLPAQPRADEWRKAITISDLQAVLAADPRPRATASTTLERVGTGTQGGGGGGGGGTKLVKGREPYQPSQAHLLVNNPGTGTGTGGDDEAATAATADDHQSSSLAATATTTTPTQAKTAEEERKTEDAVVVPSSSLSSKPSPAISATTTTAAAAAAVEEETDSLARYLCYGCLLVLSEPASASAQRANKNLHKSKNGPAAIASARRPDVDLFLPGYVGETVQRRRDQEEEEAKRRGVVGTREVRGEERMRNEVERYLLD